MKTIVNDGLKFVCSTEAEKWRARTLLTKEPGTIAWLNRVLHPGDVFYDIGANVGCYSLYAARLVGDKGKVYAFEPVPENAAALLRNIAANGFTNVRVLTAPLGYDAVGPVTFSWAGGREFWVCPTTFDQCCAEQGVVKIDVDGPEVDVLLGMRRFLSLGNGARSMQVECSPKNRAQIEDLLLRHGYGSISQNYTESGAKLIASGHHPDSIIANVIYEPVAVAVPA